jgi:hypothetical protein
LTGSRNARLRIRKARIIAESGLFAYDNGRPVALWPDLGASDTPWPTIDLVISPDAEPWGMIPDCLVPFPGTEEIRAGAIVVPVGNVGAGIEHVRRRHARKIAELNGGMSVEEYLQSALRHYQEIYLQPDGSLVLLRTNGTRKCAVVAPITIDGILSYKLITAYPLPRKPNYSRRRTVRLTLK